ncbi:MAG: hypothetical protein ABI859_13455 [Pseudomonadota bacterium]
MIIRMTPRCAVIALLVSAAATGAARAAAPACNTRPAAAASLQRLTDVMATGRYVAYQPTAIKIHNGVATVADEASIEADLRVLRPYFDGLITYGSGNGAERVADVAVRLGFRALILGVWDLQGTQELDNALAAAKRNPLRVVGLSLGNERIFAGETDYARLAQIVAAVRNRAPGLAYTTTEPFHLLQVPAAAPLLANVDFLLLNVHPAFQPWFREAPDRNAAQFVTNVLRDTAALYCGPLLVKETGVPTAPAQLGFTAARQASFYRQLQQQLPPSRTRAFAWFSAFDAPWRVTDSHPVTGPQPQEGSWGLFDEQRRPKPVVREIAALKPTP